MSNEVVAHEIVGVEDISFLTGWHVREISSGKTKEDKLDVISIQFVNDICVACDIVFIEGEAPGISGLYAVLPRSKEDFGSEFYTEEIAEK